MYDSLRVQINRAFEFWHGKSYITQYCINLSAHLVKWTHLYPKMAETTKYSL